MSKPDHHDAKVLRARLEFPVWYRAFVKSYTAWSNAPSDLKTPMLLTGQGLARAESWLIEFPDKLTDSQKRFIVRSIAQRAKQPGVAASATSKTAAKTKSKWQWRRSTDRNLWQVYAVIALGCWVFGPNIMSDILDRLLNSPEVYEIQRRQQIALTKEVNRPASSPTEGLASAETADPDAEARRIAEMTPLIPDIPKAIVPPPPPKPTEIERIATLATGKLAAGQSRVGLLLAIEAADLADLEPPASTAGPAAAQVIASPADQVDGLAKGQASLPAEPDRTASADTATSSPLKRPKLPSPALTLALAEHRTLAPLQIRTAVSPAALMCADTTGVVAITSLSGLTAWPSARSSEIRLGSVSSGSLAATAIDTQCRRILVPDEDFNLEIRSIGIATVIAPLVGHEAQITSSSFSPDGSLIVTASQDSTARLWDSRTGRQRALLTGHDWHVLEARFSPDGRYVVTASADKTARIWNASNGALVATLADHQGAVSSARFSADGRRIVTTSWDGFVRIYSAATQTLLTTVRHASGNLVSATLSDDATRLATIDAAGETQTWSLTSPTGPRQLNALPGNARAVAFSPGNRWIAVHDWHGRLALHDAETGARGLWLRHAHIRIHSFAFEPSGERLITVSEAGDRHAWPLIDTAEAALRAAKSIAPDCLTADERTLFGLAAEAPAWCSSMRTKDAKRTSR